MDNYMGFPFKADATIPPGYLKIVDQSGAVLAWIKEDGYARPSVSDPVADTARSLAGLWNEERAHREANRPNMPGAREYSHDAACQRMVAVRAAAQAIGPQVYAAFCALVTGDAGREPGVRS